MFCYGHWNVNRAIYQFAHVALGNIIPYLGPKNYDTRDLGLRAVLGVR